MEHLKHPYLLAFLAILLGVIVIFLTQPKRGDCDIHVENFKSYLKDDLYAQTRGSITLPSKLRGAINQCLEGNNFGACLHMREISLKIIEKIMGFPENCLLQLREEEGEKLKGFLKDTLSLMIAIAWSDHTPEPRVYCHETCWFESTDFALFCKLKKAFLFLFDLAEWKKLEIKLVADLFHDRPIWENNQCINCEHRRKAVGVIGFDEVKRRSLLGINCNAY